MKKFLVYQDQANEWRWTRRAANGQIVAASGEGYTRKADAIRAIKDHQNGTDEQIEVTE